MSHDLDIIDIVVNVGKWIAGAMVALVVFFIKGYHDDFKELKKSNQELKDMILEQKKEHELLKKDLDHINNNIKNYANADTRAVAQLDELENMLKAKGVI
jgi:predicted nuclease with TOPRIM domain